MKKTPKKAILSSDAHVPLLTCFLFGILFFGALIVLFAVGTEKTALLRDGILLFGAYVVLCTAILAAYFAGQRRLNATHLSLNEMNTEIYDIFKYVVDYPYAIVDAHGNVKVINRPLQELLGLKSPICNEPLSTFCQIPMQEIIRSTTEPQDARRRKALTPEGKLVPGAHSFNTWIGNRRYELFSYGLRLRGQDFYFIAFQDVSDYLELREKMEREHPVIAYIVLDNLQELAQYVRVSYRSAANEIENILKNWATERGALLREYDRDKFLLLCSAQTLKGCLEDNFEILNTIRQVRLGDNSFPVTISMGIATVGDTYLERENLAGAALDVALQRGGDQVALRTEEGLSFFGGRVKTMQDNTSIISRVNSNQLCSLAADAGNVIIMGHRNPDFDAIGACVGVARLVLSATEQKKSNVKIVTNRSCEEFKICAERLGNHALYDDIFVDADNALDLVRSDTLLIIVDVNNVRIVEAPDVVRSVANIAIIDHHRQAEVFDFTPALSYIHPTASSTSELVAEMLEQSPFAKELLKEEATLLLAGIMLDTKNFTHTTGAQTFSAVHYLYGQGAHTNVTRLFFYETLDELLTASDFGSRTHIYRDRIAITWLNPNQTRVDSVNKRTAAAKAADRLLTIRGIEAAFALVSVGDSISISARSGDSINVQIIMEKLGGGGHFDMAGAQLKDTSLAYACELLKAAIDDYLDRDADRK